MATAKITEKELAKALADNAYVIVTQTTSKGKEGVVRVPLPVFFSELYDARKDNPGDDGTTPEYASLGDFIRDLSKKISAADFDVDLSNLDLVVVDGKLHICKGDDKENPYGDGVEYGGGGGTGGYGSTLRLVSNMASREFSVMDTDEKVEISYTWTSVDTEDGSATGNGTASWYVGGTRVAVQSVPQGENTFDVKKYLTAGAANTVKLTIEDAYGNSKPITYTITVTSYGLTWNLEDMENHGANSVGLRLIPTGQGTKNLHVTVDGTEVYTEEVTTSGRTSTTIIPAQSHGAHTILAWMEMEVNGQTMQTTPLRHVGVWTAAGDTAPIVAVFNPSLDVAQYGTAQIKYMVIDPAGETANITLLEEGATVTVLTVDKTVQTWAYRAKATGAINLAIKCGETSAAIVLTVTGLGYDISPVTNGLIMDVDPSGHSNTEAGRDSFGYSDADGTNHPFTYSDNFDWVNGGFQIDADGVTGFVVKRGTYIMADRSLFSDNAKATGKEIKIIFKATAVRNYDAEILTCVSGNVGLKLQAQQAVLGSELENIVIPYCEDRKIEMDVNIEATSENSLATVWLRGIPSRGLAYGNGDSWMQTTPAMLKIGSEDCDVWIYRMKLYSNSLTKYEIMDNFVADCSDTEEMVARYERNDIYNTDGTVNIQKLAERNPTLRNIHIRADRMTTSKTDKVTCAVELIFVDGGQEYTFTATNVTMKAQGTSSLEYGLAALNLDLDFSKAAWTRGDGTEITEFSMAPNAIPVPYFNIKLNVASSENANNVCLADDYNTFQPWLSAARRADSRVRDTVEGHPCAVFFTNTSGAAISVGARTVQAGETILYGCGDMNNSKKNTVVFGQDNSQWPEQCCIEFLNNNNPQCRFLSDDLTGEAYDGEGNFEFRYPETPTETMKQAFQDMLSWVVSTNTAAATGDALDAPVVLGGSTYANDTAQYRAAKFKAEFADHFSADSMLYHYLFTERHAMVDNRAKNVFFSYEYDPDVGGYRWNVTKDYDNDTADGNDNSGGLTFTYGLEDTDSVGSAKVFNASDSVLWCNIRDFMADELAAMFVDRESAGAWSAKRILEKFSSYQAARPEAIVVEDMWAKYFMPWINNKETRYIKMMYGTKEDQRAQFETYQERYMSSKYSGAVATADRISLRANAPGDWQGVEPTGDMEITPYSDMYVTVKYGNAGTAKVRAKRGEVCPITCPADTLNDTETYIYSASNITKIGSLAGLYTKEADLSNAIRLQRVEIGSGAVGYSNGSITKIAFGANTMLEYIDLRGTPNLVQAIDLTTLTSLVELYLTGSGVTGVTFAPGAPVTTARLPSLTALVARKLSALANYTLDASKMTSVWVEETPVIDTLALAKAATGLARGRLIGVDWEDSDPDVLLRLAALGAGSGIDANGNTIDGFVLTGKAHVSSATQAEIDTLEAAFPNLELTYDTIVPSLTVTFKNYDTSELDVQTVRYGGTAVNPVTAGRCPTPTKPQTVAETFAFIGWDKSLSNITSDTVITAVFSSTPRKYTVEWYYDDAESTLLQTKVVDAYGSCDWEGDDLVKADGSVWMGWDQPTTSVVSDMKIHAVFVTPVLPDAVATGYDYLYSDNPADNSGYSLAEFCGIIEQGRAKEYFAVGEKVKITPNTTVFKDTEIIVVLLDFKHFKLADGSENFAETTWGMLGLMNANKQMNSSNVNKGGWASSLMRTYLNETIFPELPRWCKALFKQVQVMSSTGETAATISTSNDKLFLLSQAEVGFDTAAVPYKNEVDAGAENVTFPVFTDNNSRIKKTYNGTGSAAYWWLRSPLASSSTYFCSVGNGGSAHSSNASNAYGVAFGFCI